MRMLDANANRAGEGLRAIEDAMRFGYGNAEISAAARRLRHAFGSVVRRLAKRGRLLESRKSERDVGRRRWKAGQPRAGLPDLVCANFRRVQESARVLEEGARLLSAASATRELQFLRYGTYALERKAWMRMTGGRRMRKE
jgi:thiamine-phosphate pyrophosphorylase